MDTSKPSDKLNLGDQERTKGYWAVVDGKPAETRAESFTRRSQEDGIVIVTPKANELFLDIDSEDSLTYFEKASAPLFANKFGAFTYKVTSSRSGKEGHYHVVISMEDRVFDKTERVAFQACLGSDRKRELLSLYDYFNDPSTPPTVFFEEKKKSDE